MCQKEKARKKVKVVVLGDIGRSPRMQYHTLSLVEAGFEVDLIGYKDTQPLQKILENDYIHLHSMTPLNINIGFKLFQYFFKAVWQCFSLLVTLLISGKADYLLCQNPPAIPTLPVCWLYCLLTKTKFIIDWHNYAYSIMAIKLNENHPLLIIAKKIESLFGRQANYNFCVTEAMKIDLEENWNISAKVLYDRPPELFKPLTIEEKHNWFLKLSQQYPELSSYAKDSLNVSEGSVSERTLFTEYRDGRVVERNNRHGILFSSTSWTEDEDFSILLDALDEYEEAAVRGRKLPHLICVITGKGPLKNHYIDKIKVKAWKYVKVLTPWLEAEDYPLMVGSADLGVCLHTSSSGLDLPMKVVDMFGACLPVCAHHFKCLNELVKNGVNGYTFSDSEQLSNIIINWFDNFPTNDQQNKISEQMKAEIMKFRASTWQSNWSKFAKSAFLKAKQ